MRVLEFVTLAYIVALAAASPAFNNNTETNVRAGCTINSYNDVASVTASCTSISVGSFAVPAATTLKLALKAGTTLTFNGDVAFSYAEWDGPLVWITGNGINVIGGSNHLIDGRGAKWWDGHGDHSDKKKPQMMLIQATGGSKFTGLKIKNCPHTCIGISDSHDLTIDGWNIDVKDGDTAGGANTDGFDIAKSYKITIKNTNVWNQDDCICVNQGQNLLFDNLQCTGGHGLSIAVGIYSTYDLNTVYNVTFQNSVVKDSRNAIHVKTIAGPQTGEITDVTYNNIKVSGISYNGVNVQQDYTNTGDTGKPLGNIKIKNLTIKQVSGTMTGSNSQRVYILCGSGGCSGWNWSGINLSGASKGNSCNFAPSGFNC